MSFKRVALLSNPYAGTGRANVLAQARRAYDSLASQAEVLVGPGDLGANACNGSVTIVGQDHTHTRSDTIETAKAFVEHGAELVVIVSGDGTYNDALEGMKSAGATLPIFGVAAGRFNTLYPKRRHDPFVSVRGVLQPFSLSELLVEDVSGLVVRVDGEIVGYGFFWTVASNVLAYSDAQGSTIFIDAAEMLSGRVAPISALRPACGPDTCFVVRSEKLGEIVLARGPEMSMPIVAHIVDELTQIIAGGFGSMAQVMGFDGVAYCFPRSDIPFLPTPEFFPVDIRSCAFFAGDTVMLSGLNDGSVIQIDSTPIRAVSSRSVVSIEVVRALGKKARLPA